MRPDNGSTWALSEIINNKKTWEPYETNTIYPRDLKACILRIREEFRKEEKLYTENLNEFLAWLEKIDQKLNAFKDILDFNINK